jgi:ATP-dependent Lhr-like helicase
METHAQILYADHIARAALTPQKFERNLPLLHETADTLELTLQQRDDVLRGLMGAWTGHPTECELLTALQLQRD